MQPGKGLLASERLERARNLERFVENDLALRLGRAHGFAEALNLCSVRSDAAFADRESWPFLGELGVPFRLRGDE